MSFLVMYMNHISVKKYTSIENDPRILIPNLYCYDTLPISETDRNAFPYLLAAGNLFCENLFSFSFRPMDCYMLLFTTDGCGTLSVNGKNTLLKKDLLLMLDCNQNFSLQCTLLPWTFKIFFLSGNPLRLFGDLLSLKNAPVFRLPEFSHLHQSIQQLFGISSDVSMPQFLFMQQLLNRICTSLYLSDHPTAPFSGAAVPADLAEIPPYLIEMKDAFDHHYEKDFSLNACQERYGISKYRLCREFSAFFGEPPLHYLNSRRLEAAKEMLLTSDLNIHAISSLIGFDNVNHFINLFKKYVGTTPNAFRQKAPEVLPSSHSPAQ